MAKKQTSETNQDQPEPIRLSLKRKTQPIILENPDTGEDEKYLLRELTGKLRDDYINMINARMGANDKLRDTRGIQAALIAMSLFKVDAAGEEHPVTRPDVEKFPSTTQNELHRLSQKLSALGKTAEADEKND